MVESVRRKVSYILGISKRMEVSKPWKLQVRLTWSPFVTLPALCALKIQWECFGFVEVHLWKHPPLLTFSRILFYIYMYMYVYICMYVYVYTCVCTCVYIYISIHSSNWSKLFPIVVPSRKVMICFFFLIFYFLFFTYCCQSNATSTTCQANAYSKSWFFGKGCLGYFSF